MNKYGFIIDGMTWSFSRINSYCQCPYAFKRRYIDCDDGVGNAMASYGTLMHELLESYAKGETTQQQMIEYYMDMFDEAVPEQFPYNQHVDLRESYFDKGLEYLMNFDLGLNNYEILGVEKKVETKIGKYNLVGYIDLLLKDKKTGQIKIVDHKSASLKLKKDGTVGKKDQEHFADFKKQLYLYSKSVIEEYGYVDFLEWNLFKVQQTLTIPWLQDEYEESIMWAEDTINQIEEEELWLPDNSKNFVCWNICDFREDCEYKISYKEQG